jgi:hypothetical protein
VRRHSPRAIEHPAVAEFVKAHPDAVADFYRWHSFFLVLHVPVAGKPGLLGAKEGLVVKFETPGAWNATEPGKVKSVAADLSARHSP